MMIVLQHKAAEQGQDELPVPVRMADLIEQALQLGVDATKVFDGIEQRQQIFSDLEVFRRLQQICFESVGIDLAFHRYSIHCLVFNLTASVSYNPHDRRSQRTMKITTVVGWAG